MAGKLDRVVGHDHVPAALGEGIHRAGYPGLEQRGVDRAAARDVLRRTLAHDHLLSGQRDAVGRRLGDLGSLGQHAPCRVHLVLDPPGGAVVAAVGNRRRAGRGDVAPLGQVDAAIGAAVQGDGPHRRHQIAAVLDPTFPPDGQVPAGRVYRGTVRGRSREDGHLPLGGDGELAHAGGIDAGGLERQVPGDPEGSLPGRSLAEAVEAVGEVDIVRGAQVDLPRPLHQDAAVHFEVAAGEGDAPGAGLQGVRCVGRDGAGVGQGDIGSPQRHLSVGSAHDLFGVQGEAPADGSVQVLRQYDGADRAGEGEVVEASLQEQLQIPFLQMQILRGVGDAQGPPPDTGHPGCAIDLPLQGQLPGVVQAQRPGVPRDRHAHRRPVLPGYRSLGGSRTGDIDSGAVFQHDAAVGRGECQHAPGLRGGTCGKAACRPGKRL